MMWIRDKLFRAKKRKKKKILTINREKIIPRFE